VLLGAAEAVDLVRRLEGKGVDARAAAIDWPSLMAYKRTFTRDVPAMTEQGFAAKGIASYHGRARFAGPRSIRVGAELLTGRFILLATGAVPRPLGIEGEEHVATSTDFLELDALPARIVLIGGGYIAAELSHLAARAGSRVTILQRGARMLPAFDADAVGWLMERSHDIGIDVRLDTVVEGVRTIAGGYSVHASSKGQPTTVDADLVVHAAGRIPDLDELDLDAGEVRADKGRLVLDDFLRSASNPAVYAAGDAASRGPPLTPIAAYDGKIAAFNIVHGNAKKPDYTGTPSVVFTIPPLATVGLTERQARAAGMDFRVKSAKVPDWYTALRVGEPTYGYKTLVENRTDRLLGATIIGPNAEEVINVLALAIRNGLGAKALEDAIFAYPTSASDIGSML
jgi:glutathione reductase (NADPH)